jgi:hypothetical protein
VENDAAFYRKSDHDDLGYGAVPVVMLGIRAGRQGQVLKPLPPGGPPTRR